MKTMRLLYDDLGLDTKKAQQYIFKEKAYWIPLSQVKDVNLTAQIIVLPEWLVIKKGLEGYEIT